MDGSSTTWELKEEIKRLGAIWHKDFKCWKIKQITKESPAYIVLKSAGLTLQPV